MIRNYRRYYEMALNARIGNKDTVLYSVWKYLLDHEGSTPKEIFTAIPSCSYGHLKQGVEEGALAKSGRTYSANPDFSFRGADTHRNNRHNDVIEDDVEEVEEVEEETPRSSSSSSRGLNCHFYLDYDTEYDMADELPDKIEIAGYTWSRIGYLHGDSLYLCDDMVRKMAFSENESNDWRRSDIREWLNTEFYREIPSEYKYRIVKHDGDNLFLLSIDEYNKFRNNISNIHAYWWLRSPGDSTVRAADVNYDGGVIRNGDYVNYGSNGVRPALLLQ